MAFDQVSNKYAHRDHPVTAVSDDTYLSAKTATEVRRIAQTQLHDVQQVEKIGVAPQIQLDQANTKIRELANERLLQLGANPLPATSITAADGDAVERYKPVNISWLPDIANARLTKLSTHIRNNFRAYREGDATASNEAKQRMINGVFSVLPPAMFVLIPVFALLLKLFYVFRRRLYMEHLIVALNSHAFIFLSILLITLAGMLSTWLRPHAAWVGSGMGLVQSALIAHSLYGYRSIC